jgi:hypothetical protein
MNSLKKILLLLFFIGTLSTAAQQDDKMELPPMLRVLQSADFEPLVPYMNERLEVSLPNEDSNIFSLTQAKAILSDYFKKNKAIFVGFHKKNAQENSLTLTYILKTTTKSFIIFVVVKKGKIIKMKIDEGTIW